MRLFVGLLLAVFVMAGPVVASAQEPFLKNGPPTPGTGVKRPWVGKGADGEVFVDLGDGDIRHVTSGFVCSSELAGFKRDRVVVYDFSDGGRDVSCRFVINDSWFTLYFTKLPGMKGEKVFDIYIDQAQGVAKVVEAIEPPLGVGNPPLPGFARMWKSSENTVDGLWMVQIDDWFVKLRVTYAPKDEATIAAAAKAVFESVHAQVKPPEI